MYFSIDLVISCKYRQISHDEANYFLTAVEYLLISLSRMYKHFLIIKAKLSDKFALNTNH